MSKRPYLLGLTGSIGTGKSTTAAMFANAGVPVWDADAVVHRLYAQGAALGELVPNAMVDGAVDRARLREIILRDPALLSKIEAIIHPLVLQDRFDFIAKNMAADLLVFDVPLLFETKAEMGFDGVVVVTCSSEEQRRRVLTRDGMTVEMFDMILAKQMPDAAKRARANFVIDTSVGIEDAQAQVQALIARIQQEISDA